MKPGEWYQTHTEIARKVSACLGFQGRAVYDELSSRVENKSSETWVEPECLAKTFGVTPSHIRRILGRLREMNAVICLLRGNARVYRVNRTKPELVTEPQPRTSEPIGSETPQMFEPICAEMRESESPSINELDSNSKPVLEGEVVSTTPRETTPPSDPDDFCSSVAAAQTIMIPLGVSGPNWLDTLTGAVDIVIAAKRIRRRAACDFLLSQWALYQSRHGPARKKFFFSDGDFMIEQEAYGSAIELIGAASTTRINATVAREFNNDFATDEALRILRERRRERDSHDSRASPPVEVGSCD
jgi:DNA-binding transcriptional ArsR family regulator